jgi:hypothetical protein
MLTKRIGGMLLQGRGSLENGILGHIFLNFFGLKKRRVPANSWGILLLSATTTY